MADLTQKFRTATWHTWHIRERSPLFTYLIFWGAATRPHSSFPFMIKSGGSALDSVLTAADELEDYRAKLWDYFLSDRAGILRLLGAAYEKNACDRADWQTFVSRPWDTLSDQELLQNYDWYISSLLDYGPYIFIPLAIEGLLSAAAVSYLKKRFDRQWQTYEDIVMTPVKESNVVQARRSLLQLAVRAGTSESMSAEQTNGLDGFDAVNLADVENAWQKHLANFSFLKNKGFFLEFFSREEYETEIKKMTDPARELAAMNKEKAEREAAWQALLAEIGDDEAGVNLTKTTNESVYFRSWRTEAYLQSAWYARSLLAAIAARFKLPRDKDILYLYPPEVRRAIEVRELDTEIIAKRKQAYVWVSFGKEALQLEGDEALAVRPWLASAPVETHELRGTPAYRGRAEGRVVVVRGQQDFDKISSAEILVTHCTIPEIVPYLVRVKAIITEEGGILSHAALISRELKIPSVIGTRVAMQVLHDGDLVAVDAEQGIVKKIGDK